jgi:2-polyprenyl-3-methyl-5-hydroxy-6-metoxy-1,4-benzoquinol methylase
VVPTRAGYDRWASNYDEDANPLPILEGTLVEQLLGDVRGLEVLDLGCGTGRHAISMASRGARVIAVDFSEGMLERAKQKRGDANITFQVCDLTRPLPFEAATFDLVLCALVLDHIAELETFFREMRRVCRPSGFVVASTVHPAMMLRGVQARFRDPQNGAEIRPKSYPHEMSDYVMAATRAGFVFDHLSEHSVSEKLANRFDRARKYIGWPMLLLMRLSPKSPTAGSSAGRATSQDPETKRSGTRRAARGAASRSRATCRQ